MAKEEIKYTEKGIPLSIETCIENGERLLMDAQMLEFSEPPATAIALIIIAQEEFAKAFLLTLVLKGIMKWNKYLWRATRDHRCKHLLVMIMDYINPDFDEFMKRIKEDLSWVDGILPPNVADALNIFRHEKLGRWESSSWFWSEPMEYDASAKKVGNGKIDKYKQRQLYVDIKKDGSVLPHIFATQKEMEKERDRAERLCFLVKRLIHDQKETYHEYKTVEKAFSVLFSNFPAE